MSDDMGMMADCAICGKKHLISEMKEFCGELCCLSCLCANTFVCGCCHKRVARSEIATYDGDDIELCQDCFDKLFTRCEACGLLLRQSEARWHMLDGYERPYCDECYLETWGYQN